MSADDNEYRTRVCVNATRCSDALDIHCGVR